RPDRIAGGLVRSRGPEVTWREQRSRRSSGGARGQHQPRPLDAAQLEMVDGPGGIPVTRSSCNHRFPDVSIDISPQDVSRAVLGTRIRHTATGADLFGQAGRIPAFAVSL